MSEQQEDTKLTLPFLNEIGVVEQLPIEALPNLSQDPWWVRLLWRVCRLF